jgi:hypothetical protein
VRLLFCDTQRIVLYRKATMARRIVTSIVKALKDEWTQEDVHFHAHTGRPFPCYDPHCTNPRFDAG